METLKKHFETINRQSFVETSTKLRQSFGPLRAHKGPILVKKLITSMENDEIINKNKKNRKPWNFKSKNVVWR